MPFRTATPPKSSIGRSRSCWMMLPERNWPRPIAHGDRVRQRMARGTSPRPSSARSGPVTAGDVRSWAPAAGVPSPAFSSSITWCRTQRAEPLPSRTFNCAASRITNMRPSASSARRSHPSCGRARVPDTAATRTRSGPSRHTRACRGCLPLRIGVASPMAQLDAAIDPRLVPVPRALHQHAKALPVCLGVLTLPHPEVFG